MDPRAKVFLCCFPATPESQGAGSQRRQREPWIHSFCLCVEHVMSQVRGGQGPTRALQQPSLAGFTPSGPLCYSSLLGSCSTACASTSGLFDVPLSLLD